MRSLSEDYRRVEQAILFLEKNFRRQPDLEGIARSVNLSEYHFSRLFKRWAGISPKRFLRYLTIQYAKELLAESKSLLDVAYETGLSGSSRLHDLFVTLEALTPGEFKRKGAGLRITCGVHPSPFGECVLAVTERGICGLGFVAQGNRAKVVADLKRRWSEAEFREDPAVTRPYIDRIFAPTGNDHGRPLTLFLKGTNLQLKVWEALLKIPFGSAVSYGDLARQVGKPGAARAVGSAIAQNPIAFIIPCHRVIQKIGMTGDYHWGAARKKAMLAWEAARKHL